jgi:hypothetical protein
MMLGCEAEEFGNEGGLFYTVFSGNPPRSALASHVNGFNPLQRPPRRNQRAISFRQPRPLLYRPMVLFDDIVEVLALP